MNFFEWSKSCLKKNRYETKEIADEVRKKVLRERKQKTRAYYCEHCMGYHITSQLRNDRGL